MALLLTVCWAQDKYRVNGFRPVLEGRNGGDAWRTDGIYGAVVLTTIGAPRCRSPFVFYPLLCRRDGIMAESGQILSSAEIRSTVCQSFLAFGGESGVLPRIPCGKPLICFPFP